MKKILVFLSILSALLLIACPWTTVMSYDITGFQMKETANEYVFSWEPIDVSVTEQSALMQKRYERNIDYVFEIQIDGLEGMHSSAGLVLQRPCGKETSVSVDKDRLPQGNYTATVRYEYLPEGMTYAGIRYWAEMAFSVK